MPDDERQRVSDEIAAQLRARGVTLTGRESPEELADLLEAVERFERSVERSGGDLMVDEPVGPAAPIAPDDSAFVLPKRRNGESVRVFIRRIADAEARAAHARRRA